MNEEENNKINEAKKDYESSKKIAKKAATGDYLGAAIEGAKSGLIKKYIKRKIITSLIAIFLVLGIIVTIASSFFGLLDRMRNEMIDLLPNVSTTSEKGFFSKLKKFFIGDQGEYWTNIGEESEREYIIDWTTGKTLAYVDIDPETNEEKILAFRKSDLDELAAARYHKTGNALTEEETAILTAEYLKDKKTTKEKYTFVDACVKDLGDQGMLIKEMRLLGDAEYTDPNQILNNKQNKELVEKYISEFLRADYITQQIHKNKDTREVVNPKNQDELDGGAFLYRTKEKVVLSEKDFPDENSSINRNEKVKQEDYESMEFMPYEDFKDLIDAPVENSEGTNKARYKFSLDDEGNLCVVEIKTTVTLTEDLDEDAEWFPDQGDITQNKDASVSYELKEVKIPYKEYITKYAMPYEFLVSLCEITQNPEFVYHLATLARDTDIALVLQDNVSLKKESEQIKKDSYYFENYGSNVTPSSPTSGPETTQKRDTTYVKTETPVLQIEYADAWSYYDEFEYVRNIKGKLTTSPEYVTDFSPASTLSNHEEETVTDENGLEEIVDKWYDTFLLKMTSKTQILTVQTKYTKIASNSTEKSKQFLGMLRNDTGECAYDNCYDENQWKKIEPLALQCAKEAVFLEDGINVQYHVPNMTRLEAPINRLLSGKQMLYAVLQSNNKGYKEEEFLLNLSSDDPIEPSRTIQKGKDATEAAYDYESLYIVKMQKIVEHLKYLISYPASEWPENEYYTKKWIIGDEPENKKWINKYGEEIDIDDLENTEPGQYDNELTDEELEILYRICEAEAGGSSEEEIGHVASVILNRVKSSQFPNTIREVVFQPGQFAPIKDGRYYKVTISDKTRRAVDSVLAHGDTAKCAIFFKVNKTISVGQFEKGWGTCVITDPNGHAFYVTDKSKQELSSSNSYRKYW